MTLQGWPHALLPCEDYRNHRNNERSRLVRDDV